MKPTRQLPGQATQIRLPDHQSNLSIPSPTIQLTSALANNPLLEDNRIAPCKAVPMPKTIRLNETDLKEVFARSSGPGGQNVNKVASRVTLRHLPTGLSVTVQESRSQYENRRIARERLLQAIQTRERASETAARQRREKRRRQTSPRPRGLKERILESKRRRSQLKQRRGQVDPD